MQRIDYNVQTPLQLARVDERIDEDQHQGCRHGPANAPRARVSMALLGSHFTPCRSRSKSIFACSKEFDESIALEASTSVACSHFSCSCADAANQALWMLAAAACRLKLPGATTSNSKGGLN